tara:strand:- start:133 stop:1407 length:1275 start_codon:yes stop_codon:yes gene_type:complete
MKRLLAFLFIALGLGFVFSVNANAKTNIDLSFCKKKSDNYDILYPVLTENFAKHCTWEAGVKITYQNFLKDPQGQGNICFNTRTKLVSSRRSSCPENMGHSKVFYENGSFYYSKKQTQIAKTESGQTQVVENETATQENKEIEEARKKLAEEQRKLAEEQRKLEEEKKRIAEEKRKKDEEENRYKMLVKEFGDDCESSWTNLFSKYDVGTPEYKQCLVEKQNEKILKANAEAEKKAKQAKIEADKLRTQEEILAGLSPEEKREYKCEKIFDYRKNSEKYKDCIFKLYQADLDYEKIQIEKEKLELQKKLAEQQTQQKLLDAQANKDALALEQKKLEAEKKKLEVTNAQTEAALRIAKEQAAAARAQAEAAEKQAIASAMQAEELRKRNKIERGRDSDKMIRRGLKMMSNDPSAAGCTLGTLFNC